MNFRARLEARLNTGVTIDATVERSDNMASQTTRVNDLFRAAEDEGALSPDAARVLALADLGAQIQAGLGVAVDDVRASEVVLLTMTATTSCSTRCPAPRTRTPSWPTRAISTGMSCSPIAP
jgi:hypothetical protein